MNINFAHPPILLRPTTAAALLAIAFSLAGCTSNSAEPATTITVTATPVSEPENTAGNQDSPAGASTATTSEPMSPAAFAAEVRHQVADLDEDIQDLEKVHARGGSFGLVTNLAELSFNLGQLESVRAPAELSEDYAQATAGLSAAIDATSTAVSAKDDGGITSGIGQLRIASAELASLADRAG